MLTCTPPTVEDLGGSACAGDAKKVTVSVNEDLPVTDIAAVFAGTDSTRGSFDPGPNKLIAQATDIQGNTTHDLVPFVVGPALLTPVQVNAAMQSVIASHDPNTVHKAFTMVLNSVTWITATGPPRVLRPFIREFSVNSPTASAAARVLLRKEQMPW
jgi:hypothetical protein